jgi:3,4-dihydroxy 2-butanone 4-phosphate synthase/GTP cyclohydrolase II
MALLPELKQISKKFNLKIVTIEDLIAYRMQHETLIEEVVEVEIPTKFGDFKLKAFRQTTTGEEHLVLVKFFRNLFKFWKLIWRFLFIHDFYN